MAFRPFSFRLLCLSAISSACIVLFLLSALQEPGDAGAASTRAQGSANARGCVPAFASYEDMVHQFDYNRKADLQVKVLGVTRQGNVSISDITYVSQGRTISAYLVTPDGNGPFAGALFMHWLGTPNGDRTEFLNEALALASHGLVSLLPQGFFPWQIDPKDAQHDCSLVIQQTVALRRGLDVLLTQKVVDASRVAFVGHDFGAMYGAILAGVDQRFKAFALMTPVPRFSTWFVPYWLDKLGPRARLQYTIDSNAIDPLMYLPHSGSTPVLLQFARNDKYVGQPDALTLEEVATSATVVKLYDAQHELNDQATQDRDAWLSTQVGLS